MNYINDFFTNFGGNSKILVQNGLKFFNGENVIWAIFFAILGTALLFLVVSAYTIIKEIYTLWKVKNNILNSNIEADTITGTHRNFFYKKEEISNFIAKSRLINHSYQEFRETMIEDDAPDKERVLITKRPHDYLIRNLFDNTPGFYKFAKGSPNYFVGIGLLFTFVGLVSALLAATEGLGAVEGGVNLGESELKNARDAIEKASKRLLEAATFKFLASVAGLLSSIVLGVFFSISDSVLTSLTEKICNFLEKSTKFLSGVDIQRDMRKELLIQTTTLERFNTEIAVAIGDRVSESLNPLVDQLDEMSHSFGSINREALDGMIRDFNEGLSDSVGREMRETVGALDNLRSSFEDLPKTVEEVSNHVRNEMQTSTNALNSQLQSSFSETEEQVKKINTTFATGMSDAATGVQKQFEDAGNKLVQQGEHAGSVFTGEIQNAGAALSSSINDAGTNLSSEVTNAGAALSTSINDAGTKLSSEAENAGAALSSSINDAGTKLSSEVANAGEMFTKSMTKASNSLVTNLDAFSISLTQQFEPLLKSLGEFSGTMTEFQSGISTSTDLLNRVSENLSSLNDQNLNFTKALKDVSNELGPVGLAAQESIERLRDVTSNLDESLESISTLSNELKNMNHFYSENFVNMDETLAGAFKSFRDGVGEHMDAVNKYTSEMTVHFTAAIGQLAEAIEDLNENTNNDEDSNNG